MASVPFRAVFDFGSGTTKLALCQKQGSSWQTLFGEERETFVAFDVRRSGTKNAISDTLKDKVISEVGFLLSQVREFEMKEKLPPNSTPTCGFATAVYRECKNGRQVLDQVSKTHNFPIHIITQKQEAVSGFLTSAQAAARAPNILPHQELISWDSGGASFQLALGKKIQYNFNNTWQIQEVIEGPWGNSKVAYFFQKEIQKKAESEMVPGKATMNPCSPDEFATLITHIKNDLKRQVDPEDFQFVKKAAIDRNVPVVAIGGETSAFKLCSLILGRSTGITANDLRSIAQEKFIGRFDEDIAELFKKEGKVIRQMNISVGKLALLTSVMETFHIPHFAFCQSVGTTNGLAAIEELWQNNTLKSNI